MSANLVSLVRDLQRPGGRRRRGLAVAEGVRLIEEALRAGVRLRGALVASELPADSRRAALVEALVAHAVPVAEVSARLIAQLADTETPQGILAVLEPPRWSLEDIRPAPQAPVLVLDAVQDPGNVGTLLRTACGLGGAGAILLPGTAEPSNPKVLRAAMGATFRLPWAPARDDEFRAWVHRHGVTVWVAAAGGSSVRRAGPVPVHLALVVGNEGAGVRDSVRALAQQTVGIPLARGMESLNVAVAAGIVLHQVIHGA